MSDDKVQAAIAALSAGRKAEALDILKSIGAAAQGDPLALMTWALSLEPRGAESLALLERAARVGPGEAQAHFNLAVILQALGELPRAIAHYDHALRLNPGHLGALNNQSDLLRRRGRAEEGWALMRRYLEGGGSPSGLELRLAKLALDCQRLDAAERWFGEAERAAPGDPQVRFEHAMLSLGREDFARGWPGYEARLQNFGLSRLAIYPFSEPAWDGVARPGARLLLHREQGLGDMMMFASAVDGILDEGAEAHLAMAPSLNRLFTESFPRARVWSSVTALGAAAQPEQPFLKVCGPIDAQAPMASLGALRMTGGPPAPRAYLRAPAHEVARWAERMAALAPPRRGERRVGLAIGARQNGSGGDGFANGARKSVPAHEIEALSGASSVRWFSLQDRDSAAVMADVPHVPVLDLSPWITDFADTAAIIANLDLVVTVDTAVAHLAGAMGKPVWLMLWRNADWRWGFNRADSYWYPQVRTFRQARAGRWDDVVEAVVSALK